MLDPRTYTLHYVLFYLKTLKEVTFTGPTKWPPSEEFTPCLKLLKSPTLLAINYDAESFVTRYPMQKFLT